MTYHTNHCWCSNSCWDNVMFDGEVIVGIEPKLYTYTIDKYENNIKDIDFENAIEYKKVFDEKKYNEHVEMMKSIFQDENYFDKLDTLKIEELKKLFYKNIPQLKEEIVNWLNENIEDNKDGTKSWAYGNDEYLLQDGKDKFNIFFQRQIDALMFIHQWSIFKEPLQYYDYFNSQSSEIKLEKVIEIYNNYSENKIQYNDIIISEKSNRNIEFLEMYDYTLFDWEQTEVDPDTGEIYESDDIHLTKEEVKELLDKKIFNKENITLLELL